MVLKICKVKNRVFLNFVVVLVVVLVDFFVHAIQTILRYMQLKYMSSSIFIRREKKIHRVKIF